MHPLLPAETARHRKEPSTRQRIGQSLVVLSTFATVAGIGVFGSRLEMQVRVVRWFHERAIPLGFAGWALYAIPLCAFMLLLVLRSFLPRLAAGAILIGGMLAVAAMGRPRGLDAGEWKLALGPGGADFVEATSWAAYAILASAALAVILYLVRRPGRAGMTRLVISTGLISITGSLAVTLLT